MKKFIHWPSLVLGLCVAAMAGWLLHHFTNLGWWVASGIAVVAFVVNGVGAIIEDELPGGFNKPRRK